MTQLWNNRGGGFQYFRDHPFQVTLTIAGLVAGYAIGNIADVDTKYAEIELNWFDVAGTSIGTVVGNISGRVVDRDVMQSR